MKILRYTRNFTSNARRIFSSAALLAAFALLSACSCDSSTVYSQFASISADGWSRQEILSFSPLPFDSIRDEASHDVIIVMRNTDATPIDTIWIAVEESAAGQVLHNDTIPFALARTTGEWKGKGALGLYETSDTLRAFRRLPKDYHISISHAMKQERIKGIKNIGVLLARRDHKSK